MKKITTLAAMSASMLALSTAASFADYTLNILHINDLHSRIEAINKYDSTCSAEEATEGKCFGGVARLKTKIDERRDALMGANENVVVLDAGDQFQGSLFYTTYKGKAAVEFMNAIGFDAMAVGNHEFDDGPPMLAAFIDEAEFPVISGNTKVAPEAAELAGKIEENVVLEIGGEKIGIVSVLATDTDVTSSPGPNVTFEDEIEYLKGAVSAMEADGINKIILLSHVGFPKDQEIAAAVDGIDVIVGGHSHTLLSNTTEGAPAYPTMVKNPSGQDVPVVQAYAYSKYLGELEVVFNDEGVVTSATGDTILLDSSVEPDPAIAARVAELAAPIEELKQRPVSETTAPIDGSRETCRTQECEMGVLVTDAMLDRTEDQGVTIAITNGGGLRASIDQGTVTMGEVLTVLPFQNTLATFDITGEDIKASIEQGLSEIQDGGGRFPQVAGLRYTFDRSVAPNEGRLQSIETMENGEWVPLEDDKVYSVATNNFMRGGGDGYKLFAENAQNAYDYGPGLEQVVADYLAENQPYTPKTEGRITEVSAEAAPAEEAPATEQPAEETPAAAEPETKTEMAPASEEAATGNDTANSDATAPMPLLPAASSELANTAPTVPTEDAANEPQQEADTAADAAPAATEQEGETAAEPVPAPTEEQADTATDAAPAATEQETVIEPAPAPTEEQAASEAEPAATETAPAADASPVLPDLPAASSELANTAPTVPAEEAAPEPQQEATTAPEPAQPEAGEQAEAAAENGEEPAAEAPQSAMTAPDQAAEGGMAANDEPYIIKRGDNYWELAEEFYGDGEKWTMLREANPDYNPDRLPVGSPLVVPAAN